jgi:hypothetical protein
MCIMHATCVFVCCTVVVILPLSKTYLQLEINLNLNIYESIHFGTLLTIIKSTSISSIK